MFKATLRTLFIALPLALAACRSTELDVGPADEHAEAAARYRLTDEQKHFVEDLSRRTFNYFWDTTDADTCLAPDRWPSAPFSSIAAVGFAITSYGIGADRGYVPRREAALRTRQCLQYFYNAPQGPHAENVAGYKGFFYHFLELDSGTRRGNTELSSVDTSLFLGGVLFAQSYFDRDNPLERDIRETADLIYRRVDWTFMLRNRSGTQARNLEDSHGIAMGWKPGGIGYGTHDWVGYNEGMLVYVLALGSPTHPVGRDAWNRGWVSRLDRHWGEYFGQEHLTFDPLFGHQYTHVFIDFRGIQDAFMRNKGIDYFENSRRATLSQRAYARANPENWNGYGDVWGFTACDGPGFADDVLVNGEPRQFWSYSARGVSPQHVQDDGTIAPTAAGGSIPFAPEATIPALMAMQRQYGPALYTRYGFKDSFNPSYTIPGPNKHGIVVPGTGWIANDYLGIDQGPILAMLENFRSELIWRTMKKNPYIRKGLLETGFVGGWLE